MKLNDRKHGFLVLLRRHFRKKKRAVKRREEEKFEGEKITTKIRLYKIWDINVIFN